MRHPVYFEVLIHSCNTFEIFAASSAGRKHLKLINKLFFLENVLHNLNVSTYDLNLSYLPGEFTYLQHNKLYFCGIFKPADSVLLQ